MEKQQTECWIPAYNMSWLEKRVAKMNKRAAKLGLSPIEILILDTKTKRDDGSMYRKVAYNKVTLKGEPPIIGGWEFCGTIDTLDGANVIREIPGCRFPIPMHYWKVEPWCDHCEKFRTRKHTFILHNLIEDEWMQVGRTCLGDFLPDTPPEMLMGELRWISM